MIRALVERLPVMITPRWVAIRAQPIAIRDVLQYLHAALDVPVHGNPIYEIGDPDQLSYGELMREYARQRGLRRLMISVPVLTPRLSSLWLGLVTPLYARVGRKLIDSMRHSTVVQDDSALRVFAVRPAGAREAIAAALRNEDRECAETRWSDALSSSGQARHWGGVRFGNRLIDSRTARVAATPSAAFPPSGAPAVRPAGTMATCSGGFAAGWMFSAAVSAGAGAGAMRTGCKPATLLIAGAWKLSRPDGSSAWQRK